jgi:acetyl-CoA carboxylase carboxyl transferase subunit beta
MLHHKDLNENLRVCNACNHHFRMSAEKRIEILFGDNNFKEIELHIIPDDPLKFNDKKKYIDRLKEYRKKTNRNDAFILGKGDINQKNAIFGFMNFNFMGGSMGRAVGDGIVLGAKKAIENKCPYIIFTSSGGARMQEGIISLMQMPRTVAAVELLNQNKIPYIVVLTEPTTGGVTASFAMLGDITIAEKGSTIGFAGKRVIQDTIREELPIDFQKAEYLHEHGMVDIIVHRKDLKKTLSDILHHIS